MEQGIPFDPNLLLSSAQACKTADELARREQNLTAFEAMLAKRKPVVEHNVLNRLNCVIEKFDQLFKSIHHNFNDKNRYKDMLPFRFNRVILNREIGRMAASGSARPVSNSLSNSMRIMSGGEEQI